MNNVVSLSPGRRSLWGDALRRMVSDRMTIIGLIIVGTAIICAVFAPIIAPYSPLKGDLANYYLKPPSLVHPFGTDYVGRDILSRVIYGAQFSLKIAILAEAMGLAIGTVLGLITGFYGGWIDTLVMRLVDIFMAFPLLIIAIALAAALGPGEGNLPVALGLVIWPLVARLVRSQVLMIRETEYIAAARVVGVSDMGIMFRHILPNILTPLVVYGTLGLANIILQEAALSFLGLGSTEQSTPSWGRMLSDARSYILSAWWMPFYPGLAILLTVLGFNLLGDGFRDALDVRSH
jgi:peptide/nickel transport system permease protein